MPLMFGGHAATRHRARGISRREQGSSCGKVCRAGTAEPGVVQCWQLLSEAGGRAGRHTWQRPVHDCLSPTRQVCTGSPAQLELSEAEL